MIDILMVPEAAPIADGAPMASPMDVTSSFVQSELNATPVSGGNDTGDDHTTGQAVTKRGRNIRGVVDECCRKACTVHDLRMYCMLD